jgi:L-asparaginase
MEKSSLIIHGGAGRNFKEAARFPLIQKKIRKILNLSYEKLIQTNALEAVRYAVKLLEDDPEFNAGTGSMLQRDGVARLSASIMDGEKLLFAGVVNIEKIKNPIDVAFALLKEEDRVLSGKGALSFAKSLGIKPSDPRTAKAILRWKKSQGKKSDTVGACAR